METTKWEYSPMTFLLTNSFEPFTPSFYDEGSQIAMKRAIAPRYEGMESEGDIIIKFTARELNTEYGGYIQIYQHCIKDGMINHIIHFIRMLYVNSDKDMEFLFERVPILNRT